MIILLEIFYIATNKATSLSSLILSFVEWKNITFYCTLLFVRDFSVHSTPLNENESAGLDLQRSGFRGLLFRKSAVIWNCKKY